MLLGDIFEGNHDKRKYGFRSSIGHWEQAGLFLLAYVLPLTTMFGKVTAVWVFMLVLL